jgi:hypothetical protein
VFELGNYNRCAYFSDNILEEAFKADSNVGSLFANAYLVYIGLLKVGYLKVIYH